MLEGVSRKFVQTEKAAKGSPCGNFPFRTVCCESITPYFESVTIPRAFTLATIAFRSMVWCSK